MDHQEFAKQYQAAFGRLWLIAAGAIGDRSAADDIVQEAAVIAFRKVDDFEDGTNFIAWAGQIVRYCAANYQRKSVGRNTQAMDPIALDQQPDASAPSTINSRGSLSDFELVFDDVILRALSQLTAEARICLLLRVVDELPYSEIAELMDIPAGTAMSHVHRSKKQLRLGCRGESGKRAVPNE